MKLKGKYFIKGQIKAITGLHIGGSKTALDIGGIDLNVIKTAEGIPYIPGSSLKGKLRSMLAKEQGSMDVKEDEKNIREIFGFPPKQKNKDGEEIPAEQTRLLVRDSFLNNENKEKMESKEGDFSELELDYTEGKWENTIDRKSGTAGNPRQIERVPAGAIFDFEMIYDVYDDDKKEGHLKEIKKAMRLLQDDYLGGSGSRGYGKIEFGSFDEKGNWKKGKIIEVFKSIEDYVNDKDGKEIDVNLNEINQES